jgi:hypothetical protein
VASSSGFGGLTGRLAAETLSALIAQPVVEYRLSRFVLRAGVQSEIVGESHFVSFLPSQMVKQMARIVTDTRDRSPSKSGNSIDEKELPYAVERT